ncbi:hypothetical protein AB1Y20_001978 [Prymnesium parvum]|uniref:V-SNARE coiled-coil homology domain-containing protein n=1 Tax=Prymnesium parvum TaxID=97485 RepID=A0AB34J6N9_PRYPA
MEALDECEAILNSLPGEAHLGGREALEEEPSVHSMPPRPASSSQGSVESCGAQEVSATAPPPSGRQTSPFVGGGASADPLVECELIRPLFLRLTCVATRRREATQIGGLAFFDGDSRLPIASAPVDGECTAERLAFRRGQLVCELPAGARVDGYTFSTAAGSEGGDPVRWRLDGSTDLVAWVVLDDRSLEDQRVPTARGAELEVIRLETRWPQADSLPERLPPGWEELHDPWRRRRFYRNKTTGLDQWERPNYPSTELPRAEERFGGHPAEDVCGSTTWKAAAGRTDGREGYSFGDLTRSVVNTVASALSAGSPPTSTATLPQQQSPRPVAATSTGSSAASADNAATAAWRGVASPPQGRQPSSEGTAAPETSSRTASEAHARLAARSSAHRASQGLPPLPVRATAGAAAPALVSEMGESMQTAAERGEKLSRLGERSEELSGASADFLSLASEFRKQEKGKLLGIW